jgi:hypothetical protein
MARVRPGILALILAIFIFTAYTLLPSSSSSRPDVPPLDLSTSVLSGAAIMPHLGNETAKLRLSPGLSGIANGIELSSAAPPGKFYTRRSHGTL